MHNITFKSTIQSIFLRDPHPQLEASIYCVGHPRPTLRYCDKVTLIVALGFIFFYLDLWGGGHKGPRLLYYPISSHASPSHVIYHQGGHSPLSIINPLAFSLHFQGLIFRLYAFIISSPSHNLALFKFTSQSFPRQNSNCCMDLYMH